MEPPPAYTPSFTSDPQQIAYEIDLVNQLLEAVDVSLPGAGELMWHHFQSLERLKNLQTAHENINPILGPSAHAAPQLINGFGMKNGETEGENEGVDNPASPLHAPQKRGSPPEDLDFTSGRKRVTTDEDRALTLTSDLLHTSHGFMELPQNQPHMQQPTNQIGSGFGNGFSDDRSRPSQPPPLPSPAYAPINRTGPLSREHALPYQNANSSPASNLGTSAFNPTLQNPTTQNTWTLPHMDNHYQNNAFWGAAGANQQSGATTRIVDLTGDSAEDPTDDYGFSDNGYSQPEPAADTTPMDLFSELDKLYTGTQSNVAPHFGQYPIPSTMGNVSSHSYMTQDELRQFMDSTDTQSLFAEPGGVFAPNAQPRSSHQHGAGHGFQSSFSRQYGDRANAQASPARQHGDWANVQASTPYQHRGRPYSFTPNRNETPGHDPSNYRTPAAAPPLPQRTTDSSQDEPETLSLLLRDIRPEEVPPPHLREPTPSVMQSQLMEHQKIGLGWMKRMEEGPARGGLLADAMGLGKTIQAIALMCARPSENPAVKTTLIVAPVALLKQWSKEIAHHVRPEHRLTVYSYHGNRNLTYSQLCQYDVVLTTFGTLVAENGKVEAHEQSESPDPLNNKIALLGPGRRWYRVIVDEAQNMKNRATKTAKAVWALQAKYRFCMTGTPMMNSVEDLFSLLKFLRYSPYDEWGRFSFDIYKPIKGSDTNDNLREKAIQRVQTVLRTIMLRRTKDSQLDGKPMITLPPKYVVEEEVIFTKDELEFYRALEAKSQLKFNKYVKSRTVNHNYASILILLLRLRQACCHPYLIKDLTATPGVGEEQLMAQAKQFSKDEATKKRISEAEGFECVMCFDGTPNPTIFVPCGHSTCGECFQKLIDRAGEESQAGKCPICRGEINAKKITDYAHFMKVFFPERLADLGLDIAFDDLDDDSASDSDPDEDDDDLDGFVVPDGSSDDFHTSEQRAKKTSSGKGKMKPGKPKKKQTMAELKKASRANIAARARYLRRLRRSWASSAKIDKTMELLRKIYVEDPTEKTLIFSQFTSLLDLFYVPLEDEKIGYQRYDGSMSATERADAVQDFMENENTRVMLVSLKAGNAGLNLNKASRVIMLDPFWNPYVEEQAVDRAHRMRQQRPVHVYRLLVPETIEDRICQLQEKKRALIDATLDEKAARSLTTRLGVEDLMYLFRG